MKCALIRCPQTLNIYVSAAYAVPPIGLCYVAAALRKASHQVTAIDPTGEGIDRLTPIDETAQTVRRGLTDDEILDRIPLDSELIGFSLMFSQDWLEARALINRVRERFPNAVLVAGGEHFAAEPEAAITTSGLDYVLVGEGDRVICDLVEHVQGQRPLADVAGCWYRGSAGEPKRTSATVREKDIDQLAWPAWDLIVAAVRKLAEPVGDERRRDERWDPHPGDGAGPLLLLG
jgi:radical SAM superfamily enzyme YgiQ (UPF0313 family)